MKKFLTIILFLFSFLSAQETIAVIEFEGKGISQIEASALSDELEIILTKIQGYTVVERGKMEEVLQEQSFQQTGCVSEECAVEIGKMLGIKMIVVGSISKVGSTFSINAKIVDVETGKIDKTANYKYRGEIDGLFDGMADVATQLTGKSVNRTSVVTAPTTPTPPEVKIPIARPVAPSREVGSIYINTVPSNATVKIDGENHGRSPVTVRNLSVGGHRLEVSKAGYLDDSKFVTINANEIRDEVFEMKAQPLLTIMSEPKGAVVKINGKNSGKSPKENIRLNPGQYNIALSLDGYDDFTESVAIEVSDSLKIIANLIRKVGSIELLSNQPATYVLRDDNEQVVQRGTVPSRLEKVGTGNYSILVESKGFIPFFKELSIKNKLTSTTNFEMISVEELKNRLARRLAVRKFCFSTGSVLIASGAYLRSSAEDDYKNYMVATKNATQLHKQIEMKDSINPISLGLGSVLLLYSVSNNKEIQYIKALLEEGVIKL